MQTVVEKHTLRVIGTLWGVGTKFESFFIVVGCTNNLVHTGRLGIIFQILLTKLGGKKPL